MMTADSQKALVTTKAYDGVRKDRDEENILLMTFWKKILMEIFALALKYFFAPVIRRSRVKSSYRGTKIYWFREKLISA